MTPFQEKLQYWVTMNPQKACIIEAETGYTLSYAHYLNAVYAMRKFLGERPRCIALALPGGIVSAVVWLAALTGGHTLVPLPPDVADDEKLHTTHKYRPDVLIVEQAVDATGFASPKATVMTRQFSETLIEQALAEESADMQGEAREGRVCLHTSGSTGEPKGVILQAHQIAWTAEYVCKNHHLSANDRGLTVLPFFHVNAPVVSLCASLVAGSTIVIASHFSRSHFWSWVEDYQITWASIVPTILTILLDTEKPTFLPGNLRFVRTASAPLPASRLQAFEAKFAIPVIETYGLSEAASQVAANPVPPGIHKAGSVGLPVGVEMRICRPKEGKDGDDEQPWIDVGRGTIGEICFRGPSVICAYEGNAGASSFQDGWFRTGDLGYQDDDGYLFITGRLREVINRGGENVAPREVEEVLLTHPAVKETVVVGRPDSIYGEVVVAYVVLRENSTQSSRDMQQQLQQYAAQRLSSHKVPVDFMLVDDLPRTSAGKVARQVLRKQEVQRA